MAGARSKKSTEAPVAEVPAKSSKRSKSSDEAPAKKSKKSSTPAEAKSAPREKLPVTYPSLSEDKSSVEMAEVDLTNMESIMNALKAIAQYTRVLATSITRLGEASASLYHRAEREATRKRRNRPVDPNKVPTLNTFTKLYVVRPEALKFLNLPKGSFVSRTTLHTETAKYIRDHNLKGDGGSIKRDAQLNLVLAKKIVNKKTGQEETAVSFKNLQSFLNWNYGEPAPDEMQPDPVELKREKEARTSGASSSTAAPAAGKKSRKAAPAEEQAEESAEQAEESADAPVQKKSKSKGKRSKKSSGGDDE